MSLPAAENDWAMVRKSLEYCYNEAEDWAMVRKSLEYCYNEAEKCALHALE